MAKYEEPRSIISFRTFTAMKLLMLKPWSGHGNLSVNGLIALLERNTLTVVTRELNGTSPLYSPSFTRFLHSLCASLNWYPLHRPFPTADKHTQVTCQQRIIHLLLKCTRRMETPQFPQHQSHLGEIKKEPTKHHVLVIHLWCQQKLVMTWLFTT